MGDGTDGFHGFLNLKIDRLPKSFRFHACTNEWLELLHSCSMSCLGTRARVHSVSLTSYVHHTHERMNIQEGRFILEKTRISRAEGDW